MTNDKYKKQAEQIMQIAEENGVQGNFLFTTTFDRYLFLLDNYNLICLCQEHHKQAEIGKIDRDYLYRLARQREDD